MGILNVFAVIVAVWAAGGPPIEGVRKIPLRGSSDKRIYTQVIDSQKELDALLKELKREEDDDAPKAFLKAITDGKVDFTKEALILIRNTEGSGPVEVHFWLSEGRDGTLTAMIFRHVPDGDRLPLESYYCWALAVRRDRVKQIKVWRQEGSLTIPPR